ncbi:MAG: hypothetical protein ACYCZV_04930 [Acidimicrobiales bacterium]
MRLFSSSLLGIVWLIVGVIVADNHHFFHHLNHLTPALSAVLAILVWPLVLLKVHFGI